MHRARPILPLISIGCFLIFSGCQTVYDGVAPWLGDSPSEDVEVPVSTGTPQPPIDIEVIPPPESHSVPVVPLRRVTISDIEISWLAPEETSPVDAYILHVGMQPDALHREIRVVPSLLESRSDAQHGKILTYLLRDMPADRAVYVAVAAVHGEITSPLSNVFVVEPQAVSR